MKKSKIIIPAAAILALSVGASVTGTVAWFSASNRANITASNLAVVNAAGQLSATMSAISGCSGSGSTITLDYLQDASYDYTSISPENQKGNTHVAILDTDGTKVVGSRKVATEGSRSVMFGSVEKQIYYVSQWSTEFKTSSVETQYLYFDNKLTKSYVSDGIDGTDVYKALRVSMVCGEKKILWAPYTSESALSFLKDVTTFEGVDINDAEAVKSAYSGKGVLGTVDKIPEAANIKEGDLLSDATSSKLLLSTSLDKDHTATVTTTVWFEGLDPACIKNSTGINTTEMVNTVKTLTLSYYAVVENTLL
ncbi:MAG: hypothetical protein PUF99_02130 [Bacilli bacterium]|nr:hypothetical protein [Bacilli bacterium]